MEEIVIYIKDSGIAEVHVKGEPVEARIIDLDFSDDTHLAHYITDTYPLKAIPETLEEAEPLLHDEE